MQLAYAEPDLIAGDWPAAPELPPVAHQPYPVDDGAALPNIEPDEWVVDQPLVGFLVGGALSALLWGAIGAVAWMVMA